MSNNKQSNVNKEFVPYEEALALKELGFNEPCFAYWNADPSLPKPFLNLVKPFDHEWCISTPLYQQAFRWFREKHELECCLKMNYDSLNSRIMYLNGKEVYRLIIGDKKWELMNRDSEAYKMKPSYYEKTYTYEEAELACLRKLIEIVQGGNNDKVDL